MIQFVQQHPISAVMAAYWVLSAAVSSMQEPGPNSSAGYLWLYRFAHTVAGNVKTVLASKIPGLK